MTVPVYDADVLALRSCALRMKHEGEAAHLMRIADRLESLEKDSARYHFLRQAYELADINVADPGGWHPPQMVRALLQGELPISSRWPTLASGRQTVTTVDAAIDDMLALQRYRETPHHDPG